MTTGRLIFKNISRNKMRLTLTIMSIALPMFVFTVTRSLVDGIEQFFAESDNNMRVAVHQKLTYTTSLPQRIRQEIESMAPEGFVTAICRSSWFGGRVPGSQATFPSMAVDRDTFHIMYPEHGMTDEDIESFQKERRGAVVSPALANRMNWAVGDQLTLEGGLPPFPKMDFVIAAIPEDLDSPWFYFGLDYYSEVWERETGNSRGANNFWVKCSSPEAREWALSEIDKHFENTEYETRTEMESTFISSFIRSGGDWVGLAWTIGRLIVVVAAMVAFNTMSMAFRERTREIAVMRALGFPSGRITRMILYEGMLLGLFGGLIGIGPMFAATVGQPFTLPMGFEIQIPIGTAAMAMGVSVLCGLLAALTPSLQAARLAVAPALRKVV
ncbi:MAG: ABC transporter permease [Planctomycetota bacterium]|jgi:putative ABC transport system permease protein